MPITPINEAEAIIDPLWDPSLSELSQWKIAPGEGHGLKVCQTWSWAAFEWARCPAAGPALRMQRDLGMDCSDYDHLVLSVMAPPLSVVHIFAETDRGPRRLEAPPAEPKKRELALPLEGATRLDSVTIEIDAATDGIAAGWLNWLGLQDSARLARKLRSQGSQDARWDRYLKDEAFEPTFTPAYGLVLTPEELATLRDRHAALTSAGRTSPFTAAAEAAHGTPPEAMIQDFVNFWSDSRFIRERDHNKFLLTHGLNAAIAGHLLQDKSLLRLAARYALSIGMCGKWDDGFICCFPGSTFDHRCFVQSLCAYDVAGILDLAGEYFTDLGRDFLLRRLAEEAIGAIHYTTWKFEYIFHCNQLSWFTPGRMLALGVLNRHFPRVRPYLDIAYRELCENLDLTILPDGGYVEGPSYFRCVGRDAGLGLYYYSRVTGKPIDELIPPAMKRCGDFAEALVSSDDQTDVIPICDGRPSHDILSQTIMAGLLPQSAWVRMLRKAMTRNDGWPVNPVHGLVPAMADAAIAWAITAQMPTTQIAPRPFVTLPDMGPVASHRTLDGEWVKLFIQGNHGGAGHTHEDKGSFVLEFAGDTFAMDPGVCDYSHPLAGILKNCERHNMLVPFGMTERPGPALPLPADVKPIGSGDARAMRVTVDATPGWEPYYRRWKRTWESEDPATLTITDDYELVDGDGVEFYWQTMLPVELHGHAAVITGRRGRITIEAPAGGAPWRLEELPLMDGTQRRLAIRHPGHAGTLTVRVRLERLK
jgi:hypothetical protein